jgi:nitroreductase
MIKDIIEKNRSYRRFDQNHAIDRNTLKELVDLARLSASAGNLQPLKYLLSCEKERNAMIFENLAWAGYLKEWPGPSEGQRPSGYIIILLDTEIAKSPNCDHGIASQSILLGAVDKGLGGCIIASVQREKIRRALDIPGRYEILLVIALGKPAEKVVIEEVKSDGDVKYWHAEDGSHHVPKRKLDDIIIG